MFLNEGWSKEGCIFTKCLLTFDISSSLFSMSSLKLMLSLWIRDLCSSTSAEPRQRFVGTRRWARASSRCFGRTNGAESVNTGSQISLGRGVNAGLTGPSVMFKAQDEVRSDRLASSMDGKNDASLTEEFTPVDVVVDNSHDSHNTSAGDKSPPGSLSNTKTSVSISLGDGLDVELFATERIKQELHWSEVRIRVNN